MKFGPFKTTKFVIPVIYIFDYCLIKTKRATSKRFTVFKTFKKLSNTLSLAKHGILLLKLLVCKVEIDIALQLRIQQTPIMLKQSEEYFGAIVNFSGVLFLNVGVFEEISEKSALF